MLTIDKFVDHLPIFRQHQRLQRVGADILTPLYELLQRKVFESLYLMADETTMKVLDDEKKGCTHCGYLWGFRCPEEKLIFFEYHPGRDMGVPADLLKGFTGHLQVDGYGAYHQFSSRKDITVLYCMAHARRHFSEALDNDKKIGEYALTEIQKLYEIEREIKDYSTDEKYTIRQQRAVPILKSVGEWMVEQYTKVTPSSAIGKALAYSIRRWEGLSRYTTNGKLRIDNNLIENNIRPIALGRKNYLFAGSHESAQRKVGKLSTEILIKNQFLQNIKQELRAMIRSEIESERHLYNQKKEFIKELRLKSNKIGRSIDSSIGINGHFMGSKA